MIPIPKVNCIHALIYVLLYIYLYIHTVTVYWLECGESFGRRSKSIATHPVNRFTGGSSRPTPPFGHGQGKRKAKELSSSGGSQASRRSQASSSSQGAKLQRKPKCSPRLLRRGGSKQRPKLALAQPKKKKGAKALMVKELALQLHRPEKKHALLHPNPQDWFLSCIKLVI